MRFARNDKRKKQGETERNVREREEEGGGRRREEMGNERSQR